MKPHAAAIDARVSKVAGYTFDQVQCALNEALNEMFPTKEENSPSGWPHGPWVRDVFDDRVVYTHDGQLFQLQYSFADGKATLSGTPVPVRVEYTPIGGSTPPADQANSGAAAAQAPGTPDAAAGKRAITAEVFREKVAAAKGASEKLTKNAPVVWPNDMSAKRPTASLKG